MPVRTLSHPDTVLRTLLRPFFFTTLFIVSAPRLPALGVACLVIASFGHEIRHSTRRRCSMLHPLVHRYRNLPQHDPPAEVLHDCIALRSTFMIMFQSQSITSDALSLRSKYGQRCDVPVLDARTLC